MMGHRTIQRLRIPKDTLARWFRRVPLLHALVQRVAGMVSARFTVGVVGVVLDADGRMLLLEHVFHGRRPWGLPGGWLEAGERPQEGLAREIAEETGMEVEVLHPLLVDISQHSARHLDMAYLCAARGDVTALSREILSYDWVWPDAAPRLLDFHRAAVDALIAERALEEMTT
jgi:8-oxo-dGTP diphosphatase